MYLLNYFKKITLLVLGLLIFNVCFGQENYLQAYAIGMKGDTMHGFIDYRNWKKNPEKISFKKQLSDKATTFTAQNIKSFGVADEIYTRGIVLTDVSPVETNELDYIKELRTEVDTVLLQSIIIGHKSLYMFKSEADRETFYILQDTTYTLLEYKRYLAETDGAVVKENKWYLNQLAVYLNDCPTIQQDFKNLKYARKNLENLFLTYFDCTGSSIKFHNRQEKVKTEFGAVAGLTFNNLQFDPTLVYNRKEIDFSTTASYSVALFADVILARNQGKWSVYNELAFSPYMVEDIHQVYLNENEYTNYTTTLGYSYLKLNTMFRFKYPLGKAFVFVNAGMSNGFALKETNQILEEKKYYSSETNRETEVLYVTRLYEQGLIGGLGAKYDKYSFELRYERGNGMSAMLNLNSITNRFLFLFGYKF